MTPSMSRKGNGRANAPMESVFHTLKGEPVHQQTYATRDEARRDLFASIEGFYNSRRLHSGIEHRAEKRNRFRAQKMIDNNKIE